jgi:hypothetical protein
MIFSPAREEKSIKIYMYMHAHHKEDVADAFCALFFFQKVVREGVTEFFQKRKAVIVAFIVYVYKCMCVFELL